MAYQDRWKLSLAALDDEILDVVVELLEAVDVASTAASLTVAAEVEAKHVKTSRCKKLPDVVVTATMFSDPVHKHYCRRCITFRLPPTLELRHTVSSADQFFACYHIHEQMLPARKGPA